MTSEKYKERRKALGLTQPQLAEKLGVTKKTITDRERGAVGISDEAALAILSLTSEK